MELEDSKLGTVEVEICVERSTVDSFIESGYSKTLDRDLTDSELEYLTDKYADEVQMYAWENGSVNHN